jgi:signal transduction histidine kinase
MSETAVTDSPSAALSESTDSLRYRRQYAEIARLVGGLAHEIRNPLSTMSLNLDLMAEDLRDGDSPRDRRLFQKVERVRKESRRLQQILEDFLRFTRAPDLRLTHSVHLNDVVEDLRDFYEPQANSLGLIMRTHLDPSLPPISLDVDLFKQALLNLIINAQHAMPDGGELIMITRREGPWAALDVLDTGCGIPDDLQGRIFEAFFSTRPGGSGLGLPTTRGIVEAHGGSLSLQSQLGKGSKFTIRLPTSLQGPGEPPEMEEPPRGDSPPSEGLEPHRSVVG